MLAARNREKLEEAAAQIPASYVVEIDMSSAESIKTAFAQASKEFGRIDILVNNAAITKDGLSMRMKQADWDLRKLQLSLDKGKPASVYVLYGEETFLVDQALETIRNKV